MKKILNISLLIVMAFTFLFMIFSAGYFYGTEDYFKAIAFIVLTLIYIIVIFYKAKASIKL